MKKTYHLMIQQPAPAMTQTKEVFTAESYSDAVRYAHERYAQVKRTITLHTGEWDIYWYHRISGYTGIATDRNTNSGVPEATQLEPASKVEQSRLEMAHWRNRGLGRYSGRTIAEAE